MNGSQGPIKTREEMLADLVRGLTLPPEGVNAFVNRMVWDDPKTGQPLGALVMWFYGPVSAFLGAEDLRQDMYERLPDAAQVLVDCGENLSSAAMAEVKKALAGRLSF